MKRRSVTRLLALLSGVFMLAGDVIPAYAQGICGSDAQVVETAAEEENEDYTGDESVSSDDAVSENDADPEKEAVSENDAQEDADAEEETVSEDDAEETDREETVSENEAVSDNEGTEDGEEACEEDIVNAEKPSGNVVATDELGDNVVGSIYNDGGKVILYVDGKGTKMSKRFKDTALKGYAITDVVFGGNVTTVGNNAFSENASVQRVVFSGNILDIEDAAFLGCPALTSVTFEKGSGELKIEDRVFKNCTKLNNVTIPKRVTKRIGGETTYYGVFSGCTSLTNAALEDGIKYVPECAFIGASALTNISVPSSVTEIGDHAFQECIALKAFTFTGDVKRIGASAFKGTAFTSFTIPGSVTELGNWAFMDCKALGTVGFASGSGELKFGDGIFKNCINLDNVTIPKRTAKEMGSETSYYCVFSGCTSLTTVELETGIPYIPENAFMFAEGLTKVTIPSSVKAVYDNAFEHCIRLENINLPSGVSKIGREAFKECTSLTAITIPDKVTVIDDYCFQKCTVLEEIKMSKSIKSIEHYAFDGCSRLAKVYCSKSKDKVKFASGNDAIKNAEWIKTSGSTKEELITGELTLNGVKVNSLQAAFKQMKDPEQIYEIKLYSDLKGEKNLTIPKTAKTVSIESAGDKAYTVEMCGSSFSANCEYLQLTNVGFRAVDKKGALRKFTLKAKKDLVINAGVTFEAKAATVKSAGTIHVNGTLAANNVNCKELILAGKLVAVAGCKINIKSKLVSNNIYNSIELQEGFKPISVGGIGEAVVRFTGAKQADGTQIIKASAKKIKPEDLAKYFDVSGITDNKIATCLHYYKGKACIFGEAFNVNGTNYAIWKDAVNAMNAAQKNGEKIFTVTLNGNADLRGKFLMPKKGFESLIINGKGFEITFTGDITLSGKTIITSDTVLKKVNKKGEKVPGKVKNPKKYEYSGPETF